jgi:hypothetical protein
MIVGEATFMQHQFLSTEASTEYNPMFAAQFKRDYYLNIISVPREIFVTEENNLFVKQGCLHEKAVKLLASKSTFIHIIT